VIIRFNKCKIKTRNSERASKPKMRESKLRSGVKLARGVKINIGEGGVCNEADRKW